MKLDAAVSPYEIQPKGFVRQFSRRGGKLGANHFFDHILRHALSDDDPLYVYRKRPKFFY